MSRSASCGLLLIGLMLTNLFEIGVGFGAEPSPSAEEARTMEALRRMGGEVEIDEDLPSEARIAVRFRAMNAMQFAGLKKWPQVGSLTTGDVRLVPDSAFSHLADLPHLRKLTLSQSSATNATAGKLAECKELRLLYVGGARLGDAGLAALKKLPKLEILDVSNNPAITDAGLVHLAEMPRLEQLYLGGTAITDRGLQHLKPLEGLTRLHVTNTRITTPAAEQFEREMPNLRQVRR